MGDVAILIPVLKALLTQNKDLKITVLTQKFLAPLFKDLKNVSVYFIDTKIKHKGFLGLFKLYKELKKKKITAVADVHNVLRSNILKALFLGKNVVQINKGRAEKRKLVLKKNFIQLKTSHERYADVFRKLGFTIHLSSDSILEKGKVPSKIETFFSTAENKKVIGIAPFAAHKSKMYPLEKMKIVIAQLSEDYLILLFGSINDSIALSSFEVNSNTMSIAGKLNFSEELDTISNLDCMISMDSGNAHLAAIYGIKVVTIWGVTHPFAGFAPFNQPKEYAILPDLEKFPKIPTSVYGNKYPKTYLNAAASISPEEIVTKIKDIL
ncbi:heptosyltransferase [Polaribacter irgensii 23-P]|uniref:Heptosyltransferase n=1 Tax=Polaribacter irgensii 23-P TaxID=313594 RepID=A4C337_9FLAO|nr:glycosyltransferase family 9 protein [Polaribacter irgensii]EAR11508.1 heptosyltransferase [Polaribacter irgensii 23-P]